MLTGRTGVDWEHGCGLGGGLVWTGRTGVDREEWCRLGGGVVWTGRSGSADWLEEEHSNTKVEVMCCKAQIIQSAHFASYL